MSVLGNMITIAVVESLQARIKELEDELRAKLAACEPQMSFAEAHPANPNSTCKCEHWQSCPDCHPTAHAEKYNLIPVFRANCLRHPGAPHGVDIEASFRAGHAVCTCQSWAPGDAS